MAIPLFDTAKATDPEEVLLVIEGEDDRLIVHEILRAAGAPLERIRFLVGGGRKATGHWASGLAELGPWRCAVLVDQDEASTADARARAREQLSDPPAEIFCAVPAVEAWLFADDRAVLANASPDDEVQRIVRRLPLPEEIPEPRQLAHRVFGPSPQWGFMRQVDIGRAAARSPSLRVFLEGMSGLLGIPSGPVLEGVARSLDRDVIAGLVSEVSPADAIVWRTLEGDEYTASELQRHIKEGDAIGRQYTSDLLRISRDFLRRSAPGAAEPVLHPEAPPPALF
jgi:hypothetical protein